MPNNFHTPLQAERVAALYPILPCTDVTPDGIHFGSVGGLAWRVGAYGDVQVWSKGDAPYPGPSIVVPAEGPPRLEGSPGGRNDSILQIALSLLVGEEVAASVFAPWKAPDTPQEPREGGGTEPEVAEDGGEAEAPPAGPGAIDPPPVVAYEGIDFTFIDATPSTGAFSTLGATSGTLSDATPPTGTIEGDAVVAKPEATKKGRKGTPDA